MALTTRQVQTAKPKDKPYRASDEKSMYLEIMPGGAKYWRMKYRFANKEKRLVLGVFPDISLKEAREKRDEARKMLSQGIHPNDVKRAQ